VLQLPLVQHVENRSQEHVATVEHFVKKGMHRAQHSLLGQVFGATGLGKHLEIHRADESVCTVFSASCLLNSDGRLLDSSTMRPKVALAMALLAVPGGPMTKTCSLHNRASPTG
jgi:hypothetical protein